MSIFKKKQPQPEPQEQEQPKYCRPWLNRVADANNYAINDDAKKVDGILGALNRLGGHCPCGGNGDQFLCPCTIMREKGICKCGLFKTLIDRKIASSTEVKKVERNQ